MAKLLSPIRVDCNLLTRAFPLASSHCASVWVPFDLHLSKYILQIAVYVHNAIVIEPNHFAFDQCIGLAMDLV